MYSTKIFLHLRCFSKPLVPHNLHTIRNYATKTSKRTFKVPKKGESSEVSGYILLAVPVSAFGLGVWQTQRRSWKLELLKDLEDKSQAPAFPLPTDLSELERLEFRRVKVEGTFDHDREIYIGPRSRIVADTGGGGIFSQSDNTGWHVITPFRLSDRPGQSILVNRGWVPKGKLKPESRQEAQVQGRVTLTGCVRTSEQNTQFLPKNKVDSNMWAQRNVEQLSAKLDTLPVFIDADRESSIPGGPIGGQTRVTLRNEHLQYMITWFSLSALTAWLWVKKYRPR